MAVIISVVKTLVRLILELGMSLGVRVRIVDGFLGGRQLCDVHVGEVAQRLQLEVRVIDQTDLVQVIIFEQLGHLVPDKPLRLQLPEGNLPVFED